MAKATKVRVSGEIQVNLRLSANAAGLKAKKESDALLFCGQRWIRTTEVERQQIYSLPHLATLEFALILSLFQKTHLRLPYAQHPLQR